MTLIQRLISTVLTCLDSTGDNRLYLFPPPQLTCDTRTPPHHLSDHQGLPSSPEILHTKPAGYREHRNFNLLQSTEIKYDILPFPLMEPYKSLYFMLHSMTMILRCNPR